MTMPVQPSPTAPAGAQESAAIRATLAPLCAFAGAVALSAMVAGILAPPDAVQGNWQRLMYVHVPAAWTAYLAFGGVLTASVYSLRRPARAETARRWSRAAAEVGVACTALTLVSGSVWGHAVWGVWWTWDARLVSTAMLLAVYLAYLGLDSVAGSAAGASVSYRRAAWVGIGGFALVPVVHFSVVWWTTLHQQATLLAPPTRVPPIDPRMAVALALSVLAASILGFVAVLARLLVSSEAAWPSEDVLVPDVIDRVG